MSDQVGRPLTDQEITGPGTRMALEAAARKYNRALVIAAVAGAVALVVCAFSGVFAAGVLFCVGLALGVGNSILVQRSLATSVERGEPDRKGLTFSMLRRLVVMSAIAFGIAYLYQPYGWVALVGLASFQMLVMGMVFNGLVREVRRS